MGEEAVIDDELYSNIYDTMLHRLQDKVPSVRVQAVLALARLQDPRNKECPVIKGVLPTKSHLDVYYLGDFYPRLFLVARIKFRNQS